MFLVLDAVCYLSTKLSLVIMMIKNRPSKVSKAGGERLQTLAVVVNSIDLSGTSGKISAVPACLCCCLKACVEMTTESFSL